MAALTAKSRAPAAKQAMISLETQAESLADRMPELLIESRRISQTIVYGLHGRRRAGPGETFWQFRQFGDGDGRPMIDWRRSASSDRLFVREREWAAAHTFWMWPDLSASMQFKSNLSQATKRDRALVMMFALTRLLIDGGERVGVLGIMPSSADRRATERMAERLVQYDLSTTEPASLPPPARPQRFSECILFSDFLDPIEPLAARIHELAAHGVRGHLVQILDVAEETLPYDGRVEFIDVEASDSWLAPRVETLRDPYRARLLAHRDAIIELTRRMEWSFIIHRTDRPPGEALLALHARISGANRALAATARPSTTAKGT